ncbi:MAG: hypothetical protein HY457_01945 [Parcubacteria group bacterium]|nr:hypothetical protein [Parcubacteria group bacterium]
MQFNFKDSIGVRDNVFREGREILAPYIAYVQKTIDDGGYDKEEGFANLPGDEVLLTAVQTLIAEKVTGKLVYVVVLGIGGSNLGTKAVYDALHGFVDALELKRFPKLLFLDTIDARYRNALMILLKERVTSPEEILICLVSKSGGTAETIANAEYVRVELEQNLGDMSDRFVVITDPNSPLQKKADEHAIAVLTVPEKVNGRFAVLSAVGLFPLAAAGIDIRAMREGALAIQKTCLSLSVEENPALASAIALWALHKEGYTIHDTFFFNPCLESLGKWYRQLMGESVGKENDLHGQVIHMGITPTVSIGSNDLHSVGQLYIGGPKDKVTTFVVAEHTGPERTFEEGLFAGLVPELRGKTPNTIITAMFEGTKAAYKNHALPFMEVVFPDISAHSLGSFLQYKMFEMMYLAKLLNVDAFDQPNVEAFKTETKRILK